MKLCAIIITYYPNLSEVTENIQKILTGVNHLIIWENTPVSIKHQYSLQDSFKDCENITFLSTGKNEGIAYPLNRAIEWANSKGFTHILTMDQDSCWSDIKKFIYDVNKLHNQYKIFAPNALGHHYYEDNVEVSYSITSGTIYDLSIFNQVGSFSEQLFIDMIDLEFGLRASAAGYKTCLLTRHNLKHQLGYTVKGKYCISSGYSAIRRYYIVRNNLWFYRGYRHVLSKTEKSWIKYHVYREPIRMLINEDHRLKKLISTLKGIIHGLFYSHPFNPN